MSDVDMSKTVDPKSDQLNADDLIAGPRTIKITKITASSTPEQPVSVFYEGDNGKPWKPCKSMRRVLIALWGSKGSGYVGKRLTLYRDDSVKWGGIEIGGVRISHAEIDNDMTIAVTESKGKRKPTVIRKLPPEKPAAPAVPLRKQLSEACKAAGITNIGAWSAEVLKRDLKASPPTDADIEKLIETAKNGVVSESDDLFAESTETRIPGQEG
jgi:hypothetical protein